MISSLYKSHPKLIHQPLKLQSRYPALQKKHHKQYKTLLEMSPFFSCLDSALHVQMRFKVWAHVLV